MPCFCNSIGTAHDSRQTKSLTKRHAQQIANHESPKTTKLYDRTSDQIDLDEIEKIRI
jgi:hypothetical protein